MIRAVEILEVLNQPGEMPAVITLEPKATVTNASDLPQHNTTGRIQFPIPKQDIRRVKHLESRSGWIDPQICDQAIDGGDPG
jgi:hypothetical protein